MYPMRITVALWFVAICIVCVSARADQTGPSDAVAGTAVVQAPAPVDPSKDPVYICPMDPDVRSHNPGTCRRCGMNLVAGIPDPVEFHLDVETIPQPIQAERPAALQFFIHDPWKDRPVSSYNVVHEKLFHAFVVSEDLQFFRHAHPTLAADGLFQLPIVLPKAGMYRVLGDFYPAGATPQLNARTIFVPGDAPARCSSDATTRPSPARTCVCRWKRSLNRRLPEIARSCASGSIRVMGSRSISGRGRTCWPRATTSST